MTRSEIKKLLSEQGGFRAAPQQTFILPGNPYVHIDVRFNIQKDAQGRAYERPDDRALSVSRPYLGLVSMD